MTKLYTIIGGLLLIVGGLAFFLPTPKPQLQRDDTIIQKEYKLQKLIMVYPEESE